MTIGKSPQLRGLDPAEAAPGVGSFTITPSDTVDFDFVARAIYVGSTGDVALVNMDNTVVTWVGCPTGFVIPCAARRINLANTSASSLVGIL